MTELPSELVHKVMHIPRNANAIHAAEHAAAGINRAIALALTRSVGTMMCAYVFAVLAILGFPGLLSTQFSQYVQWVSQTFIQLVMLSVIMVGQGLLSRKSEIQADEQFATTNKSYHDSGQIIAHLDKQDEAILSIVQRLETNP